MKVLKFGGASVNSPERIKNVFNIIKEHYKSPLVIIISAMGKTTNALEKVAELFNKSCPSEALDLFHQIKQQHIETAKALIKNNLQECINHFNSITTEIEWILHDKPVREENYYYDQIVCAGELMSTVIISHFFNENNLPTQWIDVRDIIRTDNNFKDANVNWVETKANVETQISNKQAIWITQGFIGSTDENESTTLGREGSDYTAAIFASLLNAESMTIWKDVENVMSADPKQFPDALPIAELNYEEIIEMSYYGAQVIHPKTIKPLYQKKIPLYVKCFLNPALPGTIIHNSHIKNLPPIIVKKENQVLIRFLSKDYSFVGEKPVGELYHLFENLSIRPSLIQNGAISLSCCMDNREEKIEKLTSAAGELFDIHIEKGLTLLTVRHYREELVEHLIENREIILKQQGKEIIQILIK